MSADLTPFQFEGAELRTLVGPDGEPRFVAADIARILGYHEAHSMTRTLDDDEKGPQIVRTPGGDQELTVVTEAGLYSAILRSRVAGAKAFKRWVTHDVLPAIRRTGSYAAPAPARLPDRRELAQMVIDAEAARELAEARVEALEPLAAAAETMIATEGDWSVREAAQILSRDPGIVTGQNRLFTTLHKLGWIDGSSQPYQARVDSGHLARKIGSYEHPHTGEPRLSSQVRITGKGLAKLHAILGGTAPLRALAEVAA